MAQWTPDQKNAIDCNSPEILVAAAAGSGKTAVLVERILQKVSNPQSPTSILNLLVVTFTNAAASEMRSRIAGSLSQKLKNTHDPVVRNHLETQLILLSGAAISTLHRFCQDLIRQYIHKIGWEPSFRLLNEGESALLKEDILDQVMESYYEIGDSKFLELSDSHGNSSDDRALRELILTLHDFSLSQPWPEYWLKKIATQFDLDENSDFSTTLWGQMILRYCRLILIEAQDILTSLLAESELHQLPYCEVFREDLQVIEQLRGAWSGGWNFFADSLAAPKLFADLPRGLKKGLPAHQEEFATLLISLRDDMKKQITSLRKYFLQTDAEILSDLRATAPDLSLLCEITLQFHQAYQKVKIADGFADFSDLEHGALEILRGANSSPESPICPSETALELQEKFTELMIDEYQDTNEVQENILSLLCTSGKVHRFQVGDVKQSIYKFRLAEPELFMRKYESYPTKDYSERILLSQNFRSRKEVLKGINFLCYQLFSKDVGELIYTEEEALKVSASFPEVDENTLAGPIELHLLKKEGSTKQSEFEDNEDDPSFSEEESSFRREAHRAAQLLLSWQKKQVYDKKEKKYRDFHWRDAVILLRSVKGRTPDLLEILRRYNIPCYAEIDEGYFEETEVQTLLSVLAIIDNPQQDIHLATTLRSPIGGFTEPELSQIRLVSPRGNYWEAFLVACESKDISSPLQNRLQTFLSLYQSWRDLNRRESIPALIRRILADTSYDGWVTALSGGDLRSANLRLLQEKAQEFEASGMRGLSRFLRFIKKLREKGNDWGSARILGKDEDLVRIMSIHKSKGLEFPAVILMELGKRFNTRDQHKPVILHKKLGVGPFRTRLDLRYRYPTAAHQAIQLAIRQEEIAEELRVLYVALTRAEEKLALIGSAPDIEKKILKTALKSLNSPGFSLSPGIILNSRSYLDWLLLSLSRHPAMLPCLNQNSPIPVEEAALPVLPDGDSSWSIILKDTEDIAPKNKENFPEYPAIKNHLPLPSSVEDPSAIPTLLLWNYKQELSVGKPGKTSVTELKRRLEWMEKEDYFEPDHQSQSSKTVTKDRPRFLQEQSGQTPAEKGTQLHSLLQHLQFNEADTLEKLHSQISLLVHRGILPEKGITDLPLDSVVSLVQGSLGKRICQGKVYRELPFSALIPAEKLLSQWRQISDPVLIQGVVDLLLEEEHGYLLLDYKSDHLPRAEDFEKKYSYQLRLYREALQPLLKKPISETWIYSFHLKKPILLQQNSD